MNYFGEKFSPHYSGDEREEYVENNQSCSCEILLEEERNSIEKRVEESFLEIIEKLKPSAHRAKKMRTWDHFFAEIPVTR
jgi:hypothetical protein